MSWITFRRWIYQATPTLVRWIANIFAFMLNFIKEIISSIFDLLRA